MRRSSPSPYARDETRGTWMTTTCSPYCSRTVGSGSSPNWGIPRAFRWTTPSSVPSFESASARSAPESTTTPPGPAAASEPKIREVLMGEAERQLGDAVAVQVAGRTHAGPQVVRCPPRRPDHLPGSRQRGNSFEVDRPRAGRRGSQLGTGQQIRRARQIDVRRRRPEAPARLPAPVRSADHHVARTVSVEVHGCDGESRTDVAGQPVGARSVATRSNSTTPSAWPSARSAAGRSETAST